MSDAGHSYLGASNMHRWSACPGSFELNKTAPPGKSGRAALVGTLSHKLAEEMVRALPMTLSQEYASDWMDAWLKPMLDTSETSTGFNLTYTRDILQGVKLWGLHAVERIRAASWHGLEIRLDLTRWFAPSCPPPVPLYGRADLVTYQAPTRLLDISDFKTGGAYVSEVDNLQAFYYAAGAYFKAPGPVEFLRFNIVQPAFADRPVRSFELPAIDLHLWVDDVLRPAIERVRDPMAPLVPGDYCKWCPAAVSCPALQTLAQQQAAASFQPVTDLTDLELADALDRTRILKIWIDAVQDLAVNRINAGSHLPGWGMLPGRNRREWINGAEAPVAQVFADNGLLPADAFAPPALRSPAQMEKLCKAHGYPADVWQSVQPHIQAVPTSPRLGPVKNQGNEFNEES